MTALVREPFYSSLRSVGATRVLKLQPGRPSEPIIANLYEIDLADDPSYECLSYTWGDDPATETIRVNDADILIRRNLWQCLQRVRLVDCPRTLWVDAISISQDDLLEKAKQVEMIGDIFRKASRVLVWLGEHADGSQLIFRDFERDWYRAWINQDRPSFDAVSDEEARRILTAWSAFAARYYWTRLWILQEIALAKSVLFHCGDDKAPWVTIRNDFRRIDQARHAVPYNFADASCIQVALYAMDSRGDVATSDPGDLGALATFHYTPGIRNSNCYDRLDRVYALLSLDEKVRRKISVDYHINISRLFVGLLDAVKNTHSEGNWQRRTNGLKQHLCMEDEELYETVDIILDEKTGIDQATMDNVAYLVEHFFKIPIGPFDGEYKVKLSWHPGSIEYTVEDEEQQLQRLLRWRENARNRGVWPMSK